MFGGVSNEPALRTGQVLTSFPAKSRPFENALPLSHPASCRASAVILRQVIDPLIEPVPVFGQSLDDPHYAGRRHVVGMARMRGNSARKNRRPCRTATPRSRRKARI